MKSTFFTGIILFLCFVNPLSAQNKWMPDSGSYEYFTKGNNPEQFVSSGLTNISSDPVVTFNFHLSIKWQIPVNSGTVYLKLFTGDKDFSNKILYTNCKRNGLAQAIYINLISVNGSKFRIGLTNLDTSRDVVLPGTEWQQAGNLSSAKPLNGASLSELQHIKWISFECSNANAEMTLWIGEIKTISPTGPACIIHFNRYRNLADSLLTPYLLQKNFRANTDFNFEFAKTQKTENYSSVTFKAIGLNRIDSLIKFNGWSCTSHGTFYDLLTYLNPDERYRLCSLDSFITHGFDAHWCFSIPKDVVSASIMKEIKNRGIYKCIRKQGQGLNQLPIDNPDRLLFFRPTSASASPNLNGTPLSISEMKHFVDSVYQMKGLIILDFGTIVTVPSPLYTDVETTMLNDATALIDYADSLQIPFITFKDLFDKDTAFAEHQTANDDYFLLSDTSKRLLPVLLNDFNSSSNKSISTVSILPSHGSIILSTSGDSLWYTPSGCFDTDIFSYVVSDGINIDTANIIVKRTNFGIHALRTGFCNPNTYEVQVVISGETGAMSYLWSEGSTISNISANGGTTYSVTVTDSLGCILTDSIFLNTRWAPSPDVTNSIQCGPGIPTCTANAPGTIKWFDSLTGGNLLQTAGNTFTGVITGDTTFYVASDYGNCTSGRVPIIATIEQPYAGIKFEDDSILCPGVPYTSLSAVCDPGMSYQWYLDSIAIPGAEEHRLFPFITGNYYLEITRPEDTCKSTSAIVQVLTLDTFNIHTSGNPHFCNGDSIILSSPVSINGLSCQWYRNNILLNGSTSGSLTVYDQASYNLEITKSTGCFGFSDTINTIIDCTVGINEVSSDLMNASIYPNPNNGSSKLQIENSMTQDVNIFISDISGREIKSVYRGIINPGKMELIVHLENIPAGLYICSINGSKINLQKKLFISNQ